MFNLIISIMKSTRNLKPLWLLMFFCLIPFWAIAQTVTISGNVKDSAGVPVIGASVLEKEPLMVLSPTLTETSLYL